MSFSIIIPVSKHHPPNQLKNTLLSIQNQTLPPLETIIVIDPQADQPLFDTIKAFPNLKPLKLFKKTLNKSAARNFGASKAKANYLVHIDANDTPQPHALKQAHQLIKTKQASAIILPEDIQPTSFINRIRHLEKRFNRLDQPLITPQIIKASLFKQIKGFDPRLPILDDWSLQQRLLNTPTQFHTIKAQNIVTEPSNLSTIISRKYQRGQTFPLLKLAYPQAKTISSPKRLQTFIIHSRFFLTDPLASLGLLLLKPFEWLIFFLGTLNPLDYNRYLTSTTSANYDQFTISTNYHRYKDYASLLPTSSA